MRTRFNNTVASLYNYATVLPNISVNEGYITVLYVSLDKLHCSEEFLELCLLVIPVFVVSNNTRK